MKAKTKKKEKHPLKKKKIQPLKLWNPDGLNHKLDHRIKSIEITDEFTRIDFIYRSSKVYTNGGWISMEKSAYITPVGSGERYGLIRAEGIPIAPNKFYFSRQGVFHTYSLFYPPLPNSVTTIDIIEREAPGNFFNFYDVNYSKWMCLPHPLDISTSNN